MLRNYFITTIRNLSRNKFNTLINVSGLALSIACCTFIYAFVRHEYSFDSFHANADRIYRVVEDYKGANGMQYQGYTTFPLGDAIRNDFPELDKVTQVFNQLNVIVKIPDNNNASKIFEEDDLAYADPYFLKTFDYEFLAKQSDDLLSTPSEVILSRKLADKFFGNDINENYQELLGKTIYVEKEPYQISAIIEDIPRNTNVTFRILLPFKAFKKIFPDWSSSWDNVSSGSYTFITLNENNTPGQLESQLTDFVKKYYSQDVAERKTYRLQALNKVHTEEKYGGTIYATPSVLIIAFVSMGIIVLLTASINFINLATAQSVRRAKEIGIRKALGSLKRQLIIQFMMETFFITLTAAILGLYLAYEFIHLFNDYLSFIIDFGLQIDNSVFYFLIGLSLFITFLAGFYPANILGSFRPTEALKQSMSAKNTGFAGKFSIRKTLVVVQFVISQVLIFGTLVVAMQMRYVHERDLGFKKDDVNIVFIPEKDANKIKTLKNHIEQQSVVNRVSFNSGPPISASTSWTTIYNPQIGDTEKYGIERKATDPEYLETFDIKLLAGRNLMESDLISDDSLAIPNILLNEKAVKTLGFTSTDAAIGSTVITGKDTKSIIVGVVEDFINAPLQEQIHPCFLYNSLETIHTAAVSLNTPMASNELTFIEDGWKELYPDHFYTAVSVTDYFEINAFYVIEDVMFQSFKIFSFLSIFIGCLGLFGLVSYLALQRRKEIGIRKTLGASVHQIVFLFSKEFTFLVIIAFLLAAPLSYFAMKAWLETFEYRISLTAWHFIGTMITSIIIAWFTVGYKSLLAAKTNPIESLRNE